MRDTLLIHIAPDGPEPDETALQCHWQRFTDAPTTDAESGQDAISAVLEQVRVGERIVVLVPSERVALKQVDLPVRQSSKLLQAVPYALEDQLADDVDSLHFSLGTRQAGHITPVAVVAHTHMQQWLQPFQEALIQPDLMLPDVLALPWDAGQISVYLESEQRCLVRTAAHAGYACAPALLPSLLPAENEQALFLLQSAGTQLLEGYQVDRSQSTGSLLDTLKQFENSAQRINLLQGAYAPKRATEQWLRAARWPLALAASWVVLSSLGLFLHNQQQQTEYERLQGVALDEFSAAFPEITRIVDIRLQASQQLERLKSGGSSGGFMHLLSQSAPALKKVSALKVEGLQFRDGSLYISLSGSDLQALEVLRAEFTRIASLKLDVQSAQAGTDGVQIRLKVDQA